MSNHPEAGSSRAAAFTGAAGVALRRPATWAQLAKFCAVGLSGYAVNLGVFSLLVLSGLHYVPAAVGSFGVVVTNNYTWNRAWTFQRQRGHLVFQGFRVLLVSVAGLGVNLLFLAGLVALGLPEIPAQALAVALVTPWSFVANKLWSFRR